MEKYSFFNRYQHVFEIVCRVLGNGWRVNLLDDCDNRIKLTSPQFKNFSIHVRMEKERLIIIGSVDSKYWHSPCHTCTVSPQRNPVEIATDIEKKILINVQKDIETARLYEQELRNKIEQKKIIKGMLSQLAYLDDWYGAFTGFKVDNGLNGNISEYGHGYEMRVQGLNIDQLIRLMGLIKQL
ncbi:hypothetical protein Q0A17_23140 [Citrobacter sp. S2-9]|uniref:Uncharacterized protein n=1 Tax=Citrobacter enshiensis TaxID=2971264 RepID=A0ABT8Q0S0_9ENTR|nr:hypothetical protein [Citrobacter enshiensis]MDN8602276.1 hypothetical protein [Citrobacter enshiensis]